MLHYVEDEATRIVEITVSGRVTHDDFDAIAPKLEAFVERHGTVGFIERVHGLDGFDPGLIWDGIRLDIKLLPHISHVAVVGDARWLSPLAKAAGAVLRTEMRTFAEGDLAEARAWMRAALQAEGEPRPADDRAAGGGP